MAVTINKALNLVLPLDIAEGTMWVHSTPVSRAVFEKYHRILHRVFNAMVDENVLRTGAMCAYLYLREMAQQTVVGPGVTLWDSADGVARGLMPEIRRLTNALILSKERGGWEPIPYESVVREKMIGEEEIAGVDNALVFFTCASLVPPPIQRESMMAPLGFLAARTTLSGLMEFAGSLPISTATEISDATANIS